MKFLRNTWYVAARADEVCNTPFSRTLLDETIVFYRGAAGQVVAMDNHCPHRFAPMDQGKVLGDVIQCPYHGLRFDPSGRCILVPTGDEAPPRAKLRAYPIEERYLYVWIWMGDPALADPSAIPDFAFLEDAAFGWFDGYLHGKGNYQLLVDNLLDLAHSEFLHPLLASEGWAGRNKQTITHVGNTVTVWNVAENDNMIPVMRQMRPDMAIVGTSKHEERWDPPSLLRLSIEYYADGENIIIPSAHFLTPETATTTHYFVRGGHNVGGGVSEITEGMRVGTMNAFQTEDVPMIEAQQRYLQGRDLLDCHPAILRTDGGAVRARRSLAKLIRAEAELSKGGEEPNTFATPSAATVAPLQSFNII